jgi:hypothetical protein
MKQANELRKFDWFSIALFPQLYQAMIIKPAQFYVVKESKFIDILLITTLENQLLVIAPYTPVTILDRIPNLF